MNALALVTLSLATCCLLLATCPIQIVVATGTWLNDEESYTASKVTWNQTLWVSYSLPNTIVVFPIPEILQPAILI